MSNKTMGALYGVAAICFAVSCVNYFINGNILKGVLWLGLTVACGFLGYLRLKPQNNGDPANGEGIGNSGDPASAEGPGNSDGNVAVEDESTGDGNVAVEDESISDGGVAVEDESGNSEEANNEGESQ